MKTIAQELNIKEFPFRIKDNNGNQIYFETSTGYWNKKEFDADGRETYYEDSDSFRYKCEWDSNGNLISFENSKGYWVKREFDSNNNEIYFENSNGIIEDNRSKEVILTLDDIAEKFGIDIKDLKVKK